MIYYLRSAKEKKKTTGLAEKKLRQTGGSYTIPTGSEQIAPAPKRHEFDTQCYAGIKYFTKRYC